MQIEHHPDPMFVRYTREHALGAQPATLAILTAVATIIALPVIAVLASKSLQRLSTEIASQPLKGN